MNLSEIRSTFRTIGLTVENREQRALFNVRGRSNQHPTKRTLRLIRVNVRVLERLAQAISERGPEYRLARQAEVQREVITKVMKKIGASSDQKITALLESAA